MSRHKIEREIESWLQSLGYKIDYSLYSEVSKMCYYRPSYKVMADVTLKNIKKYNKDLLANDAWNYTRKFVNGMKSNMISNNNYFQDVFKKGLFSPTNNRQVRDLTLFDIINHKSNEYKYFKKINIDGESSSVLLDLIIIINEYPLLLIEFIDSESADSFKKGFERVEEYFEKIPMFFNYNKLIILTDGENFKVGSIYDFPEDYVGFNLKEQDETNFEFSKSDLEKVMKIEEIIGFLKYNEDTRDLKRYININRKKEEMKKKKRDVNKKETSHKETKKLNKDHERFKELSFLASIFNPNLSKTVESEEFEKKLNKLREVPNFKENKAYIEDIQTNNNLDTLEVFAKANEKLIMKELNRYRGYVTGSMDLEDMYQYGYIGLLKALERFNLERNNEFSTYATYWIRQSIERGINNDSLVIRIPVHRWDEILKIRNLEYESEIKKERVDYNWIAKKMNKSREQVDELVKIRNTYMSNVSLDTFVGANRDTRLGEFIEDESSSIEDEVLYLDLKQKLEGTLEEIDDRSKDIIIKRFGLGGRKPLTLEEIGKEYGLTRERIRQIESTALKKLKHPSKIKNYEEYKYSGG